MGILLTGGCGYIGTSLANLLIDNGYHVTVVDTMWFGNYLNSHKNLKIIQADIRDINKIPMDEIDTIIHLANIANDPSVDLNPTLSWEVNVLSAQLIAEKAIRNGVRQIIYASSGSVYGIKSESQVTEDLELIPISVYNKTKMVAERVLLSYSDKLSVHCIRPATVCGWSPRMRLDVSVNMLTFQALNNKLVTVHGGKQTRPNIHIIDMIRVYQHFIVNNEIESGCYNAGFENISILDIANRIIKKIPAELQVTKSNDPRSYRQNSDKLISTGFSPKYNVEFAIDELVEKYNAGMLEDLDNYYTVKTMKKLFI